MNLLPSACRSAPAPFIFPLFRGLFLRATGHHIAAWRDRGSGIRLDHSIALILPEFKRRGLVPENGPTGRTLRERLGLPVPAHPATLLREHSIAV